MAAAPSFTARVMIAGGRRYSLNRSGQVEPISLCVSKIAPLRFPAREKSDSEPLPISIAFASIPSRGVAGPQPSETPRRIALLVAGGIIAGRGPPSFHFTGSMYFFPFTGHPPPANPPAP